MQERIEEMRTSSKEKDNTITRLKCRLQDLEEAFENAYKLSDDKEARLRQENKMFQDVSCQAGLLRQRQLKGERVGSGLQLRKDPLP